MPMPLQHLLLLMLPPSSSVVVDAIDVADVVTVAAGIDLVVGPNAVAVAVDVVVVAPHVVGASTTAAFDAPTAVTAADDVALALAFDAATATDVSVAAVVVADDNPPGCSGRSSYSSELEPFICAKAASVVFVCGTN